MQSLDADQRFPKPCNLPARQLVSFEQVQQDFWRAWVFGTILATQRGLPPTCGNRACRRAKSCVGQVRPVNYHDRDQSCIPPCLANGAARQVPALLDKGVKKLNILIECHGLDEALKKVRQTWYW